MDSAAVKHMIENDVPFNKLVGSTVVEISATRAVCQLIERPEICNHLASIHAAALFTLGEGTAGAMVAAGFDVTRYVLTLKTAEVRYRRLAHTATATAKLDPDEYRRLHAELEAKQRVDIPINVVVHNELGEEAYLAHYVWALRPR